MNITQYITMLKETTVKNGLIHAKGKFHESLKRFLSILYLANNNCMLGPPTGNQKCRYVECSNVIFFYMIMLSSKESEEKIPDYPFSGCNRVHSNEVVNKIYEALREQQVEIVSVLETIRDLASVRPTTTKSKKGFFQVIDKNDTKELSVPFFDDTVFAPEEAPEFKVEEKLDVTPKSKAKATADSKKGITQMHVSPGSKFSKVDGERSFAQTLSKGAAPAKSSAPAAKSSEGAAPAAKSSDQPIVAPRRSSSPNSTSRPTSRPPVQKKRKVKKSAPSDELPEERLNKELLKIKQLIEKEKQDQERRERIRKENEDLMNKLRAEAENLKSKSPKLVAALKKLNKNAAKKAKSDSDSTSDSGSSESDQE